MIRKILAAFRRPWFLESKGNDAEYMKRTAAYFQQMREDQIKRRLASIRDLKASLREDIGKARRQKKARQHLYADMEDLTTEQLKLEGMLK